MKLIQTLLAVLFLLITPNLQAQITDCVSDRYQAPIFDNVRRTNDITYGAAQNVSGNMQSLEIDFYEPDPADEYLGKRPLVVMFFGGSFLGGDKQAGDMVAWCDSLARYGYACASVEYRLDNFFNFLGAGNAERAAYRAIQDGRAAIRFLLEDPNGFGFNIDRDHIYTGGNSAGAITAIHIAYADDSERPAATFSPDMGCIDCSGNSYVQPFTVAGVIDLWGAIFDVQMIDAADNVPMVIVHGDADDVVPYDSGPPYGFPIFPTVYGALPMVAELTAQNICHQFYPYPGQGHAFYGSASNGFWPPVFNHGQTFLYDKTLQFDSPVPVGALTACTSDTETYSVPANADSYFCWDVVGGTVISTNNEQITVQWDAAGTGQLTLTEASCLDVIGTEQTINVTVEACACASMDLTLNFDDNPEQTSWEILDANGVPVATGGAYTGAAGGSSTIETACLPDGCYDLVVYDSGNDGMCPRRTTTVLTGINIATLGLGGVFNGIPRVGQMCGDYTLTDASGNVVATGGGRFGTSEMNSFCIVGGVVQLQQSPDIYQRIDNDILMNVNIYPNPAYEQITIEHNIQTDNDIQIAIMDVNGRMVQANMIVNNSTTSLNVNDLPSGVYFIQMMVDDRMITEKFVKK